MTIHAPTHLAHLVNLKGIDYRNEFYGYVNVYNQWKMQISSGGKWTNEWWW